MQLVRKALSARPGENALAELIDQQNAAQVAAFREALRSVLEIYFDVELAVFKSACGSIFRIECEIDGLHIYSAVGDSFILTQCLDVASCAGGAIRRVYDLVSLGNVLRTDPAFARIVAERGSNGN